LNNFYFGNFSCYYMNFGVNWRGRKRCCQAATVPRQQQLLGCYTAADGVLLAVSSLDRTTTVSNGRAVLASLEMRHPCLVNAQGRPTPFPFFPSPWSFAAGHHMSSFEFVVTVPSQSNCLRPQLRHEPLSRPNLVVPSIDLRWEPFGRATAMGAMATSSSSSWPRASRLLLLPLFHVFGTALGHCSSSQRRLSDLWPAITGTTSATAVLWPPRHATRGRALLLTPLDPIA
jgi:hypothetical protein